ncbi:MAG: Gldg family protein [Coprococcus sp.]
MRAIYKKELRSYFTSMTGYICMAFMLVVIGIYYAIINLSSGYPYFGYTLSCVMVLFLLMTPVLTMRILAEERNRKTDQLLLTAPVSLWKIVIGKYLAMVTVFALALLITCLYPLILAKFGTVSLPMAYTAILGYFLYGAACIAIGLFLSSITESQVIAALLTFFVLLIFYITGALTDSLPGTASASFAIWAFVILFAAWLIFNLTAQAKIAIPVGVAAEVINLVIFLAKAEWMEGSVAKALSAFDMTSFFSDFASGILDVTGIIYYLSIIVFCIFLTVQSIQRRRWGGDALMTAVMLAIVVVVNLAVGQVPVKYTQFDLTDNQLYTITDETKEFVAGLDQDVDIYLIVESGNEDEDLQTVLERYESLSDHVKLHKKDPVVNPSFTKQYTESSLPDNSMIVVCGERSKVISYNDIYESEINYQTYSYQTTGFDAEGQLTSAIDYVTSGEIPKLYILTGHNESDFSSTLSSQIAKENIEVVELNLITSEAVPEDAACVFINSPQKDITADEKERLLDYMENGGHVLLITDYMETETPNLNAVLDNYGLSVSEGLIFEGNSQYYYPGYPSYLIPKIQSTDAVGDMTSDDIILMPYAQNIEISEDVRSSVTVTPILKTSSKSYIKTDLKNLTTMEKQSGDQEGPFTPGVAVTESYDGKETKFMYLTSSGLLNENMNQAVTGGNYELIVNALSWMIDKEESISIPAKSLQTTYLSVTAADAGFWGTFVIVIPIILVIAGGVVWFRRRRK